jgi:hypothetical protein
MQLERLGLPGVATGDTLAPHGVGTSPTEQKQQELTFADIHHDVAESTARANRLEAAAAGLLNVQTLMEWNGMGCAQMHSPARLGREVEDMLGLQVGKPLPRRAISIAEVRPLRLCCSRLSTRARA